MDRQKGDGLMRTLISIAVLMLCACPPRPNPNPNPPQPLAQDLAPAPMRACPAELAVSPSNVCGGLFTAEGLACVNCPGASGCLDEVDVVYCVAGACTADSRCAPR